jgi:hypothetical protein
MNAQLDLFEGLVLTTEQQEKVERFIKWENKKAQEKFKENQRKEELLVEAGFIKGINYDSKFELVTKTYEHVFGYGEDKFQTEVTYQLCAGAVYIIYPRVDKKKLEAVNDQCSVDIEGDKLMCTAITSQYRYYKPSTLLEKLAEVKERAENRVNFLKTQNAVLDYTVNKYQEKYPDATISIEEDYNSFYRNNILVIRIAFKSGSWVLLKGFSAKDKESVHKSYDANEVKGMDLLDYFNKQ